MEIERAYMAGDAGFLAGQLTPRVHSIEARLNWEIGPYYDPDLTLVFSPSVRENIDLAIRVTVAAPEIPNWHFLPAKPPKTMTSLVMRLPFGSEAEICADDWCYRVTAYNNCEFFDIEVFSKAPVCVKESDLLLLTHLLIEALVGEVTYLERIGAVTVYRPSDPRTRERTTALRFLGEHLASLLENGSGDA